MSPENGCFVLGHMLRNLRIHYMRIISVDKVTVELTPCDFFAGKYCVSRQLDAVKSLGERNESFSFGQENLPQLQDHPPQGRRARDLHRPAPQAATRLIFNSFRGRIWLV